MNRSPSPSSPGKRPRDTITSLSRLTRRQWLIGSLALPVAAAITARQLRTALAQAHPVQPPNWQERLVLDTETVAWSSVGPRTVDGVVYHRLEAPLDSADVYLRSLPSGGPNFCDTSFGGCTKLFDFGIDHITGAIYVWNDPWGAAHPGVSAHRSPWADGLVSNPSEQANRFLARMPDEPESVERNLASVAVSGGLDEEISEDGWLAIAWLSAYLADFHFPDSTTYPYFSDKVSFVFEHREFDSATLCPGAVVASNRAWIVSQTQAVMDFYRGG